MTGTNQKLEDAVLKRMLETPPTPHVPKKDAPNGETKAKRGKGGKS